MPSGEQYPYRLMNSGEGMASLSPYLPLTLSLASNQVPAIGLVDSGAAINVLPYDLGLRLGAIWEHQTTPVELTGNLAATEARVLIIIANIGSFPPVRQAFAWTRANAIPLILGQVNFFLEFDVCLFRSRSVFEVKTKS